MADYSEEDENLRLRVPRSAKTSACTRGRSCLRGGCIGKRTEFPAAFCGSSGARSLRFSLRSGRTEQRTPPFPFLTAHFLPSKASCYSIKQQYRMNHYVLYDLIGSVVLLLQNLNFTLVLFPCPVIADAHRQDPSCIFGLSGHIALEFQGIFFIPDLLDCRIWRGVNFQFQYDAVCTLVHFRIKNKVHIAKRRFFSQHICKFFHQLLIRDADFPILIT